jgi:hypothetical protein
LRRQARSKYCERSLYFENLQSAKRARFSGEGGRVVARKDEGGER